MSVKTKSLITSLCLAITFLLMLAACRSGRPQALLNTDSSIHKPEVVGAPPVFSDSIFEALHRPDVVKTFYNDIGFQLAWMRNGSLSATGDSILTVIRRLRYFGLVPEAYHLTALQNELSFSPCNVTRIDVLLSDACLSLLNDIGPKTTMPANDSLDLVVLKNMMAKGGVEKNLRAREPRLAGYQALKRALKNILDSLGQRYGTAILSTESLMNNAAYPTIQKLEINLQRWRAERAALGDYYAFVNIPAFMLYVVSHDSIVMESKVIVGMPDKQTPELSSIIDCIVTYPYWNVPRKIAVEEYLPMIQANVHSLERNNFDVLDRNGNILNADSVDWKTFNKNFFPVLLRQREGPENALGVIKFIFDNPYGVFLHDTNAKRLFKNQVRAYSHGCIRMEKAEQFAHYLVMGDLTHRSKYLENFLARKQKHFVTLKRPIPIYVRYLTADIVNNRLLLYPDIYSKDIQALAGSLSSQSIKAPDIQ